MDEIVCPDCGTKGQWTEPRDFNMMLKTYLGPIESEEGLHYLRPETAQGIFVNFANVVTTARKKPRPSWYSTGLATRSPSTASAYSSAAERNTAAATSATKPGAERVAAGSAAAARSSADDTAACRLRTSSAPAPSRTARARASRSRRNGATRRACNSGSRSP